MIDIIIVILKAIFGITLLYFIAYAFLSIFWTRIDYQSNWITFIYLSIIVILIMIFLLLDFYES